MRLSIVGLDHQCPIIARQCLLVALEPMEHRTLVRQSTRRARIAPQRRTDQLEGFERPVLPVSNEPQQMQCIEMIGLRSQNLEIEGLGLRQPTIPIMDICPIELPG